MAGLHLAPSSSAAPEQKLVHRPSPYMRRVRLPRLDFSIRQNAQYSHHLPPYFMDNDLPSPEELMAKIELINFKNKQVNGNNHLQRQQKRPNGVDLNGNTKMGKKKNNEEEERKIISSGSSNKCPKNQQNKTPNGQKMEEIKKFAKGVKNKK